MPGETRDDPTRDSGCRGQLIGLAVRSSPRIPLRSLEAALVSCEGGLEGDFRGRPGPRQVTVLATEDWGGACRELGLELPWTARRANLLVEGLPLYESRGWTLHIGEVLLEVTGETDPCGRMDEAAPGLRAALAPRWRGGVCCRVIRGGQLALGMPIEFAPGERTPPSRPAGC